MSRSGENNPPIAHLLNHLLSGKALDQAARVDAIKEPTMPRRRVGPDRLDPGRRICAMTGHRDGTGKRSRSDRGPGDGPRPCSLPVYQATGPAGCACDNREPPATIVDSGKKRARFGLRSGSFDRSRKNHPPTPWEGERRRSPGGTERIFPLTP